MPGQKWEPEILAKLERADIIVLLLSTDLIRSDYCMQKEMKRAIERDAAWMEVTKQLDRVLAQLRQR